MIDSLLLCSNGFFKWENGFRTMTVACETPGAVWVADGAHGTIPASAKGVRILSPLSSTPAICGFLLPRGGALTVLSALPDEAALAAAAQKLFPGTTVRVQEEAATPSAPEKAAGSEPAAQNVTERAAQSAPALVPETVPTSFWECNAEEMTRLLNENPVETAMNDLIPGSRWVRVREEGAEYLAGVIYDEESKPLYLCYGFERPWSETPPDDLEGYSQWIPYDFSDPHGKGCWVIYTDAATGARVR